MRTLATLVTVIFVARGHAANLLPAVPITKGDICGTVVKVGDLEEDRDTITMSTDAGESLKIYVEGASVAISPELMRATIALADGLHYCARVRAIDDKTVYLIRSAVERRK